ncbi:MAG: glycosyl hydrolase, partial [Candidatus Baltobacteraceae bacterium]
ITPPGSILFGLFVNEHKGGTASTAQLGDLEKHIGRHASLSLHFRGFTTSFPGEDEADDLANGRTPIESWNCGDSNANVAAGRDDEIIKRRADALKAYGHPIFVRYMWEMNLPTHDNHRAACYDASTDLPKSRFSPQQFVAAWNHIHQIFVNEGAANVIWFWCPSGRTNPMAYYPGSASVDWVGFDAYDRHGGPFADTYRDAYGWMAGLGKPIMIGETAAQAQSQTAFFESAARTLQSDFPLVKGFVYFDAPGNVGGWNVSDVSAFAKMVNDPYFAGKLQP